MAKAAFVKVPKDLNAVRGKLALGMTKRQLICFGLGAAVGIPVYLMARNILGTDGAIFTMIGIMAPFFFIALYEKDGQPAEKILRNLLRSKFYRPQIRIFTTTNLYKTIEREIQQNEQTRQIAKQAKQQAKTAAAKKRK
jgi:hypothetical protein